MFEFGTVETFVDISKEAKTEIKRQLSLHSDPDAGVRIIVVIDRYVGHVYDLEFDNAKENDHKALVDGIPIHVNTSLLDFVKGMKIEYDPEEHVFSLKNENPSYNCVPGAKFECPSCNLYDERKDDPKYSAQA
ncbi:MAG: iron-sulfur cluster biosynthesis family protein [Candidatus Heimdallarchaeota archaeon]|nr:iron-sulfur cluster biosynthesis family protein [Candidatus Heimdallarchaeota archaeon]